MSGGNKMSDWEVKNLSRIVTLLIKDSSLVQSWTLLYHELGVSDPNFVQWRITFLNGTLEPYDLFMNILVSWKSQKGDAATFNSLCETLRNIQKASAAESLEREFRATTTSDTTQSLWPIWFNVRPVNKHFVGRLKQLTQLQTWLENPSDQIILISGLGGIGQTEVTKKFTHEVHKKGNTSCTWFDAETEQSLNQSLIDLGKTIGIQTIDNEERKVRKTLEIFTDLIRIIRQNSVSWLVIFDNVDEVHPDLLVCLQLLYEYENACTILTSRNRSMAKEDWQVISLEEWEIPDAIEFIKYSLQIEEDDLIVELCARLGNHALAMQQAVAYIFHQKWNSISGSSYSIQDYINEFDAGGKKTGELLNHKLSEVSHKFAKTTFVTWDLTLANIKETKGKVGRLACSILDLIAYLDPTGIKLEFLAICLRAVEKSTQSFSFFENFFVSPKTTAKSSEELVKSAVGLLKSYSLVKVENAVIFIHRLVQEVIRLKLNSLGAEFSLLEFLIEVIQTFSPFSRSELAHVLSVWKYSSKHENLIRNYPSVPFIIFNRLSHFGLISEMFNFASLNYTRFQEVLGEDHPFTLRMKHNSARALDEKGEWEKSLGTYKEVWEKQKEILGEEHKDTLVTAHNMAKVLRKLNRLTDAEELYEKVWKSRTKTLGENHPDTMSTKHNLALVLSQKGEVDLALKMLNELLEWRKEKLGERHPHSLGTRRNIAYFCLFPQGKYLEAKEMLEDVWELCKVELGEEHPQTINCMHSLGKTLYKLSGQEEKALQFLQQVLTLEKKIRGVNYPLTLEAEQLIQEIEAKNRKQVAQGVMFSKLWFVHELRVFIYSICLWAIYLLVEW